VRTMVYLDSQLAQPVDSTPGRTIHPNVIPTKNTWLHDMLQSRS